MKQMIAKTVETVHTIRFISQAKKRQNRITKEEKLEVTIAKIVALFSDINFIKINNNIENKFI